MPSLKGKGEKNVRKTGDKVGKGAGANPRTPEPRTKDGNDNTAHSVKVKNEIRISCQRSLCIFSFINDGEKRDGDAKRGGGENASRSRGQLGRIFVPRMATAEAGAFMVSGGGSSSLSDRNVGS
jgi:hypothetical protein